MRKTVKITVLKAEYDQTLADRYAIPDLGPCPFHRVGQVLYTDGLRMPEGMCGGTWQLLQPWIRRLAEGKLVQPSGTWLRDDTKAVFTCVDGVRPVTFLLEAQE